MDMDSDAIKQVEAAHSEMSARLVKAREDLATNEVRRHETRPPQRAAPARRGEN